MIGAPSFSQQSTLDGAIVGKPRAMSDTYSFLNHRFPGPLLELACWGKDTGRRGRGRIHHAPLNLEGTHFPSFSKGLYLTRVDDK